MFEYRHNDQRRKLNEREGAWIADNTMSAVLEDKRDIIQRILEENEGEMIKVLLESIDGALIKATGRNNYSRGYLEDRNGNIYSYQRFMIVMFL